MPATPDRKIVVIDDEEDIRDVLSLSLLDGGMDLLDSGFAGNDGQRIQEGWECHTRIVWVRTRVREGDSITPRSFGSWPPGEKIPRGDTVPDGD